MRLIIFILLVICFSGCLWAQDSAVKLLKQAKTHLDEGKYPMAINAAYKALKQAEKEHNRFLIGKSYWLLGSISYYNNQDDKNKALKYYSDALHVYEKIREDSLCAMLNYNLGAIYIEKKEFDSAVVRLNKSKDFFKNRKQYWHISRINSVLAEMYLPESTQIEKSLPYIREAIKFALLSKDSGATSFAYIKQGIYYLNQKRYNEALPSFQLAESMIDRKNTQEVMYVTRLLAQCYAGRHDTTTNWLYNRYIKLLDSVFKKESAEKTAKYEVVYETGKKEEQNKYLKQQDELKRQELRYKNVLIVALIIIIVLIAVIILWRINVISLKKKNQELEAIRKIEKERSRISRDLHDNVGSLVSFVNTKVDWILKNKSIQPDLRDDLSLVKQNSKEILEGLRDSIWTLNSSSISNFDLVDKLKAYVKNSLLIPYSIYDKLENEIEFSSETVLALYRSCQEIINNINKHSKATGVQIDFYDTPKVALGIRISDNGIGMREGDQDKENHYGLRNIRSRLEEVNATFHIQSDGAGTIVRIEIAQMHYSKKENHVTIL